MNIKIIKLLNHKMTNIIPPHAHSSPPNIVLPKITPPTIAKSIISPETGSSIAKKVTDDLFASSTFVGTKTPQNSHFCQVLKDRLNKCVNKGADCSNIKNTYDELCK